MGQTQYFHLAFFDFGDDLNTDLSAQKEIDRFVLIDKQLYGLYSVVGNGVISGWAVRDGGYSYSKGISIIVESGLGIINYIASETTISSTIQNLPSNSILDIYAVIRGSTVQNRSVDFQYYDSGTTVNNGLKLAQVITGENGITAIDNTIKEYVSYQQAIEQEINNHKHRGTPSKIDLKEEVKNQLPGARIEGIDASKIQSGVLDLERLPLIDHNDLDNKGLLTHAALDAFVKTLSQTNKELLGEVVTVDLLKSIIFLKYFYPDFDEDFLNELILIPGITPNEFIDFEASTANISLEDNCITGVPAQTGLYTSIVWDDQESFYNSYLKNNVVVSSGEVSLERSGQNVLKVEDFNRLGQGLPISGFDSQIVSTESNISITSDISDSNKVEGDSAGAFSASFTPQAIYTKDLRTDIGNNIGLNLTGEYDELVLWVKTTNQVHEEVNLKLITYNASEEQEEEIGAFTIIEKDSITTNEDSTKNQFEQVVIGLSNEDISNITKIVIYTNEVSSDFTFYVDDMYFRRQNLVAPTGVIRLRYNTESDVIFHSLFYDSIVPDNTSMQVRVKAANDESLLTRSSYTLPLMSGDIFSLSGSSIEIEVEMTCSDQVSTPVLDKLELRMMVDGDFSGFDITSASDWERGDFENISIQDVNINESDLVLTSPINVGGYYFSYADSISELDNNNIGKVGFSGNKMPISPAQALHWDVSPYRKFDLASSVVRKFNKNYLIADTYNDRVLEVSPEGELVKGVGSSHVAHDDFAPLSFVYNYESKILSLVFTKKCNVSDITKISIYIGSIKLNLSNKDTVINTKSEGRVIEIKLHEDTWVQLSNVSNSFETDITVYFNDGALDVNISSDVIFLPYGYYGYKCFVGDFTYIDSISHPVFIKELLEGNWLICNSSVRHNDLEGANINVPGILELNVNTWETEYSNNSVVFSDYTLGSVYEYDDNKFLVAGLRTGDTLDSEITGEDIKNNAIEVTDRVEFRASAVDSLADYRGTVFLIDKLNNKVKPFYNSPDGLYPSDLATYEDGSSLIAESSFVNNAGRVVKIDSFGNITWIYGTGSFNIISDAKVLSNENILISL